MLHRPYWTQKSRSPPSTRPKWRHGPERSCVEHGLIVCSGSRNTDAPEVSTCPVLLSESWVLQEQRTCSFMDENVQGPSRIPYS